MLTNYTPSKIETLIEYELMFDYGNGSGFGFPCDEYGHVGNLNPDAAKNLAYCMNNPQEFCRWNELVAIKREYKVPANGWCKCGELVMLENDYYGAYQCPNCGRWYNLFGQEILPPDKWDIDPSDEESYWE